jgi:hypothetical protein
MLAGFFMFAIRVNSMEQIHFGIHSAKRGTASEFCNYILREGAHAARGDFVGYDYGNMPGWARYDPKSFFVASDKFERKNSPPFISMTYSLPSDLSNAENMALGSKIADRLAGDRPFLLAVHSPISSLAGVPHPHGHLMVSGRVDDGILRSPEQTFGRFNSAHPERGGSKKQGGGMRPSELKQSTIEMRRIIAEEINNALRDKGRSTRVDHRTLREQGIDREPVPYVGPAQIRRMKERSRGVARVTYCR